jgi:glycosyltransferase involved in cell wall biosynthesis
VRAVFEQAERLTGRGWRVAVASPERRPDWFDLSVEFFQVPVLSGEHLPSAECYVATYWTTVVAAVEAGSAAIHLTQGYEGDFPENSHESERIASAYQLPTFKVATSIPLRDLVVTRFNQPCRLIRYGIDGTTFNPHQRVATTASRRLRVVVPGPFEVPWKGIRRALTGVATARESGIPIEIVRVSQLPQTDAERAVCVADEYHTHLTAEQMAALFSSCDILLALSTPEEGFGLPPVEAMACGCAAVLSRIPSFASYGRAVDFADPFCLFVEGDDPTEVCESLGRLVEDRALRSSLVDAGGQVAARYEWRLVIQGVEAAYRDIWAAYRAGTDPQPQR